MNWLTNYIRPKIKEVAQKEVPSDLWVKCSSCTKMIFHKEVEQNQNICPHCGHHFRISAKARMEMLLDEGYSEIKITEIKEDPLDFNDLKKYSDRLRDARKSLGIDEAFILAFGEMEKSPAVLGVFDFRFMGGSMGSFVGEGVVKGCEYAMAKQCPFVVVTAAGGARMQEGMISLMQMARTTAAVHRLKEAGLPFIVVLTDPTTGGVTASFAMLGDITIAEPKALIAFAGPRVIKETIRQELPEGFQKAEYLLEHGMIDMVVDRKNMKAELAKLIRLLTRKQLNLAAG